MPLVLLPITGLFAALFAIMLVVLSLLVSFGRIKAKANIGDGGDAALLTRIRAQGNFIEFVPLGLIVLGLCEASDTIDAALWTIGGALLLGRFCHALSMYTGVMPLRGLGMILTYLALLGGAYRLLSVYFL